MRSIKNTWQIETNRKEYGIIYKSRGREMRKCQLAISKCSEKNQRKSKNPLDKIKKVWYNIKVN